MTYIDIIDHLFWALDLYETNKPTNRLPYHRKFDLKQKSYILEHKKKLIKALCDQTDDDAIDLINGLLSFCDAACTFIFNKHVITHLPRKEIYAYYLEFILLPLLISFIKLLNEFRDSSLFIVHIENLLNIIQDEASQGKITKEKLIAFAARKLLRKILEAPECVHYRGILLELINTLKWSGNQRRETIEACINDASTYCLKFKSKYEQQKSELTLETFKAAYIACRAIVYFEHKTKLGIPLAVFYKATTTAKLTPFNFRIHQLCSSIKELIFNNDLLCQREVITPDAAKCLEGLWRISLREFKRIERKNYEHEQTINNPYYVQNINSLLYFLGIATVRVAHFELTNYKMSEQFFKIVATCDDFHYLKPYSLLLKVIYHVQHNLLQDALTELECDDAKLINETIGPLPYYAAIFTIGLSIKIRPPKIKQDTFNPFVNVIINNQPSYSNPIINDAVMLGLNFESAFSDSYSQTILHSIKKFNSIVTHAIRHLTLPLAPEKYPPQIISNAWDKVEEMLSQVCEVMDSPKKAYKPILTKHNRHKLLIPYLPNSTLYKCIRELTLLSSFFVFSPETHPYTSRLFNDLDSSIEERKRILKAIDEDEFQSDSQWVRKGN